MYASHIIRSPVITALLTAGVAFLCSLVVLNAAIWPYFSWLMLGADYFAGISRGIAPFVRGGCQDLAEARGAASLIMLALGTAVIAGAVVTCVTAHSPRGKPIDDRQRDWEEQFDKISIVRPLRIAGLFFGLLVSAAAIGYLWLKGGELWSNSVAPCAGSTPLGQAAFVCSYGFVALAPPLALLKRVYRFVYDVSRFRQA